MEPFFDTASFKTSDLGFRIKGENAFFIDTLELEKRAGRPYALVKMFLGDAAGRRGIFQSLDLLAKHKMRLSFDLSHGGGMGIQDPGGLALIPLATILIDLSDVREAMEASSRREGRTEEALGDETGRLIDFVKVVWANEEFRKAFGVGTEGITRATLRSFGASGGHAAFTEMLTGFGAGADLVDSEASLGPGLSFRVRATWFGRKGDWSSVLVSCDGFHDAAGDGRPCLEALVAEREARRLIREKEERLSLALGCTGAVPWDWDLVTDRVLLDPGWKRLLGIEPGSLEGQEKRRRWADFCHPEDLGRSADILARHLSGEIPRYANEIRMRHADGHWCWIMLQGEVTERSAGGRPLRMVGLAFDIGAQKEAEARLVRALDEKHALLGEVFHRTRNSMQLINAMLELKKQEFPDPSVSAAFEDIQNKIIAMSLVYGKLYETGTISSLDLGSYVEDLMDSLRSELPAAARDIRMTAEADHVEVTPDVAVPCGLMLSELVGNSIAHAFPWRHEGHIDVSITKDDGGEIVIVERDDGVGLPAGFDPRLGGHVGLRTVIGIGEEQLRGKVSFSSGDDGFACSFRFRDTYRPLRVGHASQQPSEGRP